MSKIGATYDNLCSMYLERPEMLSSLLEMNASRHPNGFSKRYLVDTCQTNGSREFIRAHLWQETASEPVRANRVHSHRWDFVSTVITGSLRYEFFEEAEKGSQYSELEYLPGTSTRAHVLKYVRSVKLKNTRTIEISSGDRINQKAIELHKVDPIVRPSVTLVWGIQHPICQPVRVMDQALHAADIVVN